MQRGEHRGVGLAILSIVSVVGILAVASMITEPTGHVAQGQPIEPEVWYDVALCQGPAYHMGYVGMYEVVCCQEHRTDQNNCAKPIHVPLTN